MPGDLIRYPFTDQGLRDCLVALGTTETAVATILSAMGVRGRRGVECGCPLAVYVATVLDVATNAYVYLDDNDTEVHVLAQCRTDGVTVGQVSATAGGPLPIFVRRFDLGRFPELEVPDAA
jgi:hypothetical protein